MPEYVPFNRHGELPLYVNGYQLESRTGYDTVWSSGTRTDIPWRWVPNTPFVFRGSLASIVASRSAAEVWIRDSVTDKMYPMRGDSFTSLLQTQGYFGYVTFRADFEKCGTRYFLRYLGPPECSQSENTSMPQPLSSAGLP